MNTERREKRREKRFWSRVRKTRKCWLWTGSINKKGYGVFASEHSNLAHRYSWVLAHGITVPDQLYVLHTCDCRHCVNPSHLYAGTPQDNVDDMMERGRWTPFRGEENPQAKLTEADVKEIRRRCGAGETQASVAQEYGITPVTVSCVCTGKNWGWLPGSRPARPRVFLQPSDISKIRAKLTTGHTHCSIAKLFGVSRTAVTAIATGQNWADVA